MISDSEDDASLRKSLELRPITTTIIRGDDGEVEEPAERGSSSSLNQIESSEDRKTTHSNGSNSDLDALDVDTINSHSEDSSKSSNSAKPSLWKHASSPLSNLDITPLGSSRSTGTRFHDGYAGSIASSGTVDNVFQRQDSMDMTPSFDSISLVSHGLSDTNDMDSLIAGKTKPDMAIKPDPKLGDVIPSVAQKSDNQTKLYRSLSLLEDMKELKEMKVFDDQYNEKMDKLKKAQLDMLGNMIQINQNTFTEFYNVWNTVEDTSNEGEQKHKNSSEVFDINDSKMFDQLNEGSKTITKNIEGIRKYIEQIDRYTTDLWS